MSKQQIVLITGNVGKLNEFKKYFGDSITNMKIDLVEIQGSPQEIVLAKLKQAYDIVNPAGTPLDKIRLVVVDDTSLCFDAHGGNLPGPFIKFYLEQLGADGLYKMIEPHYNHLGTASCLIGVKWGFAEHEYRLFEGRTNCFIVPPRGSANFGWDSICQPFIPLGENESAAPPMGTPVETISEEVNKKSFAEMTAEEKATFLRGKTFAEMTMEEKQTVSHRGKALDLLKSFLGN